MQIRCSSELVWISCPETTNKVARHTKEDAEDEDKGKQKSVRPDDEEKPKTKENLKGSDP